MAPDIISTASRWFFTTPVAEPSARADLGLRHAPVVAEPEHVAESLAQQHGRLGQRERRRPAELDLAAREHAGPRGAVGRQVDVDERVAGLRVDGRRHDPHPPFGGGAVRVGQPHAHARFHARQLDRGHLGAPLEPSLPDQVQHLVFDGPRQQQRPVERFQVDACGDGKGGHPDDYRTPVRM